MQPRSLQKASKARAAAERLQPTCPRYIHRVTVGVFERIQAYTMYSQMQSQIQKSQCKYL